MWKQTLSFPLTAQFWRSAAPGWPLTALANLLIACKDFHPDLAWRWAWVHGQRLSVEPTLAWVTHVLGKRRPGPLTLTLAVEGAEPTVQLRYQRDHSHAPFVYDFLHLHIPRTLPSLSTVNAVTDYFQVLASAFGAKIAGMTHPDLSALVLAPAAREIAEAAGVTPPAGAELLEPLLPAEISPDLAERLASQAPTRHFHRARIPDGVWWLNYWSREVVDNLDRQTVLDAPWQVVVPLEDAWLFKATPYAPHGNDKTGLEKIATLAEHIDLKTRQAAFK